MVSHVSAYTFSASASAWSADRPQRSFVPVHSLMCRQCASGSGGFHSARSLSALARLVRAVTATREVETSRSFAYASRRFASHALEPAGRGRHASCAVFEAAGGVGKVFRGER
ncbi:hypothetical protein Shyd_85440 [Streptomyces hydrogenans]|uniref:Uncharacterized protein n=1 Tax=Streptomyces hydrogenans TaxID=1873719 RepID=A0ABQ3PQ75_9ACTN|nr:hypothetical protein GCM10018784_68770 [Streptomyces hydrogenans]GHI27173.1 hypothetical protein Shyd_85440 [Streptomyces hydrogenans]